MPTNDGLMFLNPAFEKSVVISVAEVMCGAKELLLHSERIVCVKQTYMR